MATQTTGGGSVTSFTNTPQARDDNYVFLEDVLRANTSLYDAVTGTIFLDVMANDLGGSAKTLFSVEDGDGNPLTADFDLLAKDVNATGVSLWEETLNHNWVRINNGKIEYRIADGSGVPGQGRSVDSLTAGQAFADQFVYAIRLGNGTLSEATVKINITGANDNASIAVVGASANSVTESGVNPGNSPYLGDPSAGGTLLVNDADLGQNHFQNPSPGSLNGTYGAFTFNATTGQWSYTLNNSDSDTQALGQGASATETLTVTSFDGTASFNIVVTITGTNDGPVAVADTNSGDAVVEAGVNLGNAAYAGDATAIGNVLANDTDVDTGDTKTVSAVNGVAGNVGSAVTGTYGSVTINANGSYSYALNNADPDTQALAQGATATDAFTYIVKDSNGATSSTTLTITLHGTNDVPVAVADVNGPDVVSEAGVNPGNTAFAGDPAAIGNVLANDTDVDTGATKTVSAVNGVAGNVGSAVTGTYGSVTINANGSYSYALNNADPDTNALAQGQVVTDQFTYTMVDDFGAISSTTLTITITGTNDAPVLASPIPDQSSSEDAPWNYTVPAGSFADADNATLSYSATLADGSALPSWLTFNAATRTFAGTPPQDFNGMLDLKVTASDGSASANDTFTITITAVNDAPVNTLPASFTTNEDTSVKLSGLSVADVDAGAGNITVTLSVASGTLTAATAGGVTITSSGTGSIVLSGTLANINTYLSTVANQPTYVPVANANGAVTLTMITSDFGNSGSGGTLTDTDTRSITIAAVNDAPVNTLPASFTTNEDTSVQLSGLSVADVDAGAGTISVTLSVASGTLTAANAGSVTVTGSGTGSIVLSGTLANINTYLSTVANQPTYVPVANANGAVTLTMTTSDLGNSGSGGTLTDTDTSTINITAVNDAPVNTLPASFTTNVNASVKLSGLSVSDIDAGAGTINVTLSVASGTLTAANAGSVTVTGSGTGSIVLSGTLANINTYLSTVANQPNYVPVANAAGAVALTMTTSDLGNTGAGGTLTDADASTINVNSPSPFALTTSPNDVVFYSTGTNFVTGTNATLNGTDKLTGGSGTDTLTVTDGSLGPFTFGTGNLTMTGFEVLKLVDTNNGNHTDNLTFLASFNNGGTLTVDASGIAGNGKLVMNASATSNAFNVIGGNDTDTITLGSGNDVANGGNGNDTINGGGGNDRITGAVGQDTLTGGTGNDTFAVLATADINSTPDQITDFDAGSISTTVDKLEFTIGGGIRFSVGDNDTLVENFKSGANGIINVAGTEVAVKTDVPLTTAQIQTTIDGYNNIVTGAIFVVLNSTVGHAQVWYDPNPSAAGGAILVADLNSITTLAGLANFDASDFAFGTATAPAGVAGEPINLGLAPPVDDGSLITVTISNVPEEWSVAGGTRQTDGSWIIQTTDVSSLTITSPASYQGAVMLDMTLSWVNADGSSGSVHVLDNVEAYAAGNPIFAWSGDDTLTGSAGADTFVFSQPIGNDVVHNFAVSADTIDLIAYAAFTSFADVLANLSQTANGDALIMLADGQTITLVGVSASELTAANFVFDVTPAVINAGTIAIGDGALLPLSGIINNSGTISLGAQTSSATLELIQNGITLQGGGNLVLFDSSGNMIIGTVATVTFNNVDNIISGAGQLGDGSLILTNGGTIIANGFNALVIDTGANSVINSGTIEATGLGGLEIVGSIVNSGLIWAAGGNVFIGGDLTGTGDVHISGTATVEIGGSDSNNVVVGSGAAGLLVLDDAIGFSGKISGLNADDRVDLRDIAFGAGTTMTYADDGTGGGMLTVTDGVNSVHLALVGAYQLQNFSLLSDGQGGSLLTNNAGATIDYGSGIVDVTQFLSVPGSTDVIADGYLRVTTTGLVQIDADGGGNVWVTLGHVNPAGGQYTVEYLSGGVVTDIIVAPVAPPIALDLNGDGVVSFLTTDAGATFNYGGGTVATAWVGAQDGILVRDANHDGRVTATEIVFATSGSDLQGLAVYDSNHDGQLSSADAKFGEFAVWQDANSNGKVDAGEFQSLTARGITSISLNSDGVPYSAAGGDVSVVGTGSFTRADGTTGVLADAVFATGSRPAEEQLRTTSAANTNVALIGAVAAAGLVAMPAAAAAHLGESGVPSGPDLTSAHNGVVSSLSVPAEGQATTIDDMLLQPAFDADSVAKFAGHGESKEALPSSSEHGLINPEAAAQPGPAELLAGTDAPAQSATTAAVVVMPSAEQMQAFIASSVSAPGAHQSNEIVSKILVNALSGGKDDPDLDALINTLKGHGSGGAEAALPALASHAAALMPGGGVNDFGDFMVHPFASHMEGLALHPDAPQAAA